MNSKRIVVIGAGVGGLATAAALARLGHAVTVLEAHIYPGGVAGTFSYQGHRFDAGATLAAGFYPGGPMDLVGRSVGIHWWPVESLDPAMLVHLPNRPPVSRWSDGRRRFWIGSRISQEACPRRIDHADR
jgi:phytoene dehydrogenase-like protein